MSGEGFRTTIDESSLIADPEEARLPGLVIIYAGTKPRYVPIRLDPGSIVLGRYAESGVILVDDERVSRRHTRVTAKGDGVRVEDLESRNGTFVDGVRITDETYAKLPRVLRVGQSILYFVPDLRPFLLASVELLPDQVIGPILRRSREAIARAAEAGDSILLTGPSGSGKELAARAFHASGPSAKGPFVAVNCATIPTGLAERLLFGARKGAYSGSVADSEGVIQAADGGTLFLDEIAELDLAVQPKLLRVLESHEVVSLGASHPRKVDVRVCAATLKELRAEVKESRFREDLYYRIGRPEVRVPSLVERLEELPWLIVRELERVDPRLTAHHMLIEACALRPWPGNVRELTGEIRSAAREALADGRTIVKAQDLPDIAGMEISAAPEDTRPSSPGDRAPDLTDEAMLEGLKRAEGNVTAAARALGIHRNQLRRWITRRGLDPKKFGSGSGNDEGAEP